ncbi:hypothetical protein [Pseudoalteromonas sp. MEBiC 03485]|uniref:hypothetical protein n=1 Tax=Pseudoalteromonas sp. MEBiC 03485 TaxID=2571103 RepID=UPI001021C145|nr:hypothetical protein [Pseudoalteromonas sp. MEBiC 03485]RZD19658.1 hypothetical protein EVU92_20880 [Pseudoalteromonas sp. MEBiC 03485]
MESILDFLVFIIPILTIVPESGSISLQVLHYDYTISVIGLSLVASLYFSLYFLVKHTLIGYPREELNRAIYLCLEKPARYKTYAARWFKVSLLLLTIFASLLSFAKNQVFLENIKQEQIARTLEDRRHLDLHKRVEKIESALRKEK